MPSNPEPSRPDDAPRLPALLDRYFQGGWGLRRRIRDLTSGETGRLSGVAQFSPIGQMLAFTEHGRLLLNHSQMEARQSYHFVAEGPGAFTVFFDDGRPFHRADFTSGTAWVTHDCASDTYRGRYRILSPTRWSLGWRITGPRKNLVIVSVFSRSGVG